LNWQSIIPEIVTALTAIIIIVADMLSSKKALPTLLSLTGILASLVFTFMARNDSPGAIFNGMLLSDGFSQFMRLTLLVIAAAVILSSTAYYANLKHSWAEYHALILFALTGLLFMPACGDLVSAFVAVEITAISFFILVGLLKDSRSTEASIKMMLIGSISAAVMLYGMALVFGVTASTGLEKIGLVIAADLEVSGILLLGVLLLGAGLLFEIAAVPFHMWAPDTYEGAPTPITMYLSTGSKIAGMAILARIFSIAFLQPQTLSHDWGIIMAVISALTMTAGNLLALQQNNIKRLLAYSGIAHSGYMLIGISTIGLSQGASGLTNLLFYMVAFALAEVTVFATVIIITGFLKTDDITGFAGMGRRAPFISVLLSLGLISMIGLPPTAGFMAKLFIFTGAIENGLAWLIIIAVLNTALSAFYYLRIVKTIWFIKPSADDIMPPQPVPGTVAALTGLGLLLLGIMPYLLIKLAESATITLH
jgi:NADH-quinone oxidoreductase subunit N